MVTGREGEKDQATAGVGIRFKNLQVDYAYTPHKDLGNTQIVSLIWRFTKKSDKNKAIVSVADDKEKAEDTVVSITEDKDEEVVPMQEEPTLKENEQIKFEGKVTGDYKYLGKGYIKFEVISGEFSEDKAVIILDENGKIIAMGSSSDAVTSSNLSSSKLI